MTDGNLIFKSKSEQKIEAATGLDVASGLRQLYDELGSQEKVAARVGISRTTVIELMAKHRIPTIDRRTIAAAS